MTDRSTTDASEHSVMSDYDAYRARRTFGSLDGFRCMSIVAVIWHHSRGDIGFGRLGLRGFLGVHVFFVLSGFPIVTLLLREHARNGQISLKAFYARRTLRIMPLYWFTSPTRSGSGGFPTFFLLRWRRSAPSRWRSSVTAITKRHFCG